MASALEFALSSMDASQKNLIQISSSTGTEIIMAAQVQALLAISGALIAILEEVKAK